MDSQYQRINISLPLQTIERLDNAVTPGNRSRFIDTAVTAYLDSKSRQQLRTALKKGSLERAKRDQLIVTERFEPSDI